MLTGEPIPQQKGEGIVSMPGQWYRTAVCCFVPVRRQPYYAVTNHSHGAPGPEQQPEIGQLADKISAVFVPVVVSLRWSVRQSGISLARHRKLLYPGDCHHGADYRLSVCAGTATPMSIISGVGRAAEFGVLVGTPTRCNAPVRSTPWCSIKPDADRREAAGCRSKNIC